MRRIVIAIAVGAAVVIGGTLFILLRDKPQPKPAAPQAPEAPVVNISVSEEADATTGFEASYSEYQTEINDTELFVSRIEISPVLPARLSDSPNGGRIIIIPSTVPHFVQANINGGDKKAWTCDIQETAVICQGDESLDFSQNSFFDIYYEVKVPTPQSVKLELLNDGKKIYDVVVPLDKLPK